MLARKGGGGVDIKLVNLKHLLQKVYMVEKSKEIDRLGEREVRFHLPIIACV